MAGLFQTYQLLEVQRKFKRLPSFWLNFFPRQVNFEEEAIAFDKVHGNYARLAPFVAPTAQGRVLKHEGFHRKAFKPAYVKPKDVVDPNMILPVQPGEIPAMGKLSLAQRRAAVITYLLQQQRAMHENRWEWMAAQAAIYGYVDVAGEDYPTTRVDFGRDAALTITANWKDAGAKPLDDIYAARRLANDKSVSGATVTKIIMGATAWGDFYAREKDRLKDLMDKTQVNGNTSVTKLWDGFEGIEYMGRISGFTGGGLIEIWVDTRKYTDEAGQMQYLMPQNGCVGISEAIQGVRCFGAILDKGAGYQALPFYPKNWENEDPSVEYLMSQGAPLMVPSDPNASFLIKTST